MNQKIMIVLNRVEKIVLAVFVLASVAIAFVAVFFRYILNNALAWPEEITSFLILGVSVFGSSIAFKEKQHANLDLIDASISKAMRSFLALCVRVLSLFVTLVMTVYSIKFVIDTYQSGQSSTSMEVLPMWIPMTLLPIGFAFMTLRCLDLLLNLNKGE